MTNDTGGQAFPSNFVDDREPGGFRDEPGMDLLDYFAGLVLGGLSSSAGTLKGIEDACKMDGEEVDTLLGTAKIAYAYAEAMIEEKRERENG